MGKKRKNQKRDQKRKREWEKRSGDWEEGTRGADDIKNYRVLNKGDTADFIFCVNKGGFAESVCKHPRSHPRGNRQCSQSTPAPPKHKSRLGNQVVSAVTRQKTLFPKLGRSSLQLSSAKHWVQV